MRNRHIKEKSMVKLFKQLKATFGGEKWMIFGGYNLVLQDVDYQTNDIDVYTTLKGLSNINERYKCKLKCGDNWVGLDFKINGKDIQAISEQLSKKQFYLTYLSNNYIKFIKFDDIRIPCLKLDYQIQGYQSVWKAKKGFSDPSDKIKLIDAKLKTKQISKINFGHEKSVQQ